MCEWTIMHNSLRMYFNDQTHTIAQTGYIQTYLVFERTVS